MCILLCSAHMCQGMCGKIRGQPLGVSSLLLHPVSLSHFEASVSTYGVIISYFLFCLPFFCFLLLKQNMGVLGKENQELGPKKHVGNSLINSKKSKYVLDFMANNTLS